MNFRLKNFLIVSIYLIFSCIYFSITSPSGFVLYGSLIFMITVFYFLVYWLLNFEVLLEGLVSILIPPSVFVGGYLMTYNFFIKDQSLTLIFISIVFMIILTYYFLLTQNILNISCYQNIGLSQAAFVVNNFYSVISFFITILGVLLLPETLLFVRFIITIFVFVILFLPFAVINQIDKLHIFYSILNYSSIILILCFSYMLNFINPDNIVLFSVILSIVYRGITVVSQYSVRKVLSIMDLLQIIFESILIGFFLYLITI